MDDIKELITRLRANNRKSGWSDIDRLMDEAAEALENLDAQLDVLVKEDIEAQQELAGYRALGTLEHLQGIVEAPMPLTLDELQDMDGDPVWTITNGLEGSGRWELVWFSGLDGEEFVTMVNAVEGMYRCPVETYGRTWLAYRRKPKEEQYAND